MPNEKIYNLLEMSYVDVQDWLRETDVILVPIGSCERHGAHVPLGTDSFITYGITVRAAKKADVPHAPLFPAGYSPHHMWEPLKGAGTITLSGATFRGLIYDIARSLIYHGFNKIIFVSHHGSNSKIIDDILRKIRYETGALPIWYKTPTERELTVIKDLIEGPPEESPGWHAGEQETAMVLAYDPKLVKMERAVKDSAHAPRWLGDKFFKRDGTPTVMFEGSENIFIPMEHYEYSDSATLGNPFRATREKGEKMFEKASEHLARFAMEMKKVSVVAKVRDFPERAL